MCSFFVLLALSEYACILALYKWRRKSRGRVRVVANKIDCIFGLVISLVFMTYNLHHFSWADVLFTMCLKNILMLFRIVEISYL